MKVDGVSFNARFVNSFETPEAFAGHKSNEHLWPGIEPHVKKQKLLLVYELAKLYKK